MERLDVVGLEAELRLVGVVDGERQAGHGLAELDRVLRLPCDGEDARLDVAVDAESLGHIDHALVLGHGRVECLIEGLALVFVDHAGEHHDAVESRGGGDLGDLLVGLLAPFPLLGVGVVDVHPEVAAEELGDFEPVLFRRAPDVVGLALRVVEVGDEPLGNVGGEGAHPAGADVDHVEAHFLHDLARLFQVDLSERERRACHSDRHFHTSKSVFRAEWGDCIQRLGGRQRERYTDGGGGAMMCAILRSPIFTDSHHAGRSRYHSPDYRGCGGIPA